MGKLTWHRDPERRHKRAHNSKFSKQQFSGNAPTHKKPHEHHPQNVSVHWWSRHGGATTTRQLQQRRNKRLTLTKRLAAMADATAAAATTTPKGHKTSGAYAHFTTQNKASQNPNTAARGSALKFVRSETPNAYHERHSSATGHHDCSDDAGGHSAGDTRHPMKYVRGTSASGHDHLTCAQPSTSKTYEGWKYVRQHSSSCESAAYMPSEQKKQAHSMSNSRSFHSAKKTRTMQHDWKPRSSVAAMTEGKRPRRLPNALLKAQHQQKLPKNVPGKRHPMMSSRMQSKPHLHAKLNSKGKHAQDASDRELCMIYVRTGKCPSGKSKCRFKHDPEKVAICSKWLAKKCDGSNCPLTHRIVPERMPVCSHFLHGTCSNPQCPYRHVKVNENAPPCKPFLRGFCPRGVSCTRRHSYVCPSLEVHGQCEQRDRCPYHHPPAKQSGTATSSSASKEHRLEQLRRKRRNIGESSNTIADDTSLQSQSLDLIPSFAVPEAE